MGGKKIKVGVRQGAGPPPGFEWTVLILDCVYSAALSRFSPAQYEHLRMQVQELARHKSPTHSEILSIRKIGECWELRDKGGVLGKLNVRLFFGIDADNRRIVILDVIKKENDGATHTHDKRRMEYRWRQYLRSEFE